MIKSFYGEIISLVNSIFDFFLVNAPDAGGYYIIYSAMTQVLALFCAVLVIFVILRIHIQREKIRNAVTCLKKSYSIDGSFPIRVLKDKILERLEQERSKDQDNYLRLREQYDNLTVCENVLRYIILAGKNILSQLGALFLYYLVMLHLLSLHFVFKLPALFFGTVVSLVIISKTFHFFISFIQPIRGERYEIV